MRFIASSLNDQRNLVFLFEVDAEFLFYLFRWSNKTYYDTFWWVLISDHICPKTKIALLNSLFFWANGIFSLIMVTDWNEERDGKGRKRKEEESPTRERREGEREREPKPTPHNQRNKTAHETQSEWVTQNHCSNGVVVKLNIKTEAIFIIQNITSEINISFHLFFISRSPLLLRRPGDRVSPLSYSENMNHFGFRDYEQWTLIRNFN